MNESPWNKDRIIGQKGPLQISHIWGIRIRLELEGKTRDLALFNMAFDSKLRGCDLVKIKVSDIVYGSIGNALVGMFFIGFAARLASATS